MRGGELVQDAPRRIFRTVISRDDLQTWVIDFHQRGERRRQLFLFVSRGQQNRDARAIRVGGSREILDPGEAYGAIGNAEAVGEPEERDQAKKYQSEELHGNWCQRCPQVMLTRD